MKSNRNPYIEWYPGHWGFGFEFIVDPPHRSRPAWNINLDITLIYGTLAVGVWVNPRRA